MPDGARASAVSRLQGDPDQRAASVRAVLARSAQLHCRHPRAAGRPGQGFAGALLGAAPLCGDCLSFRSTCRGLQRLENHLRQAMTVTLLAFTTH